MPHDASHSDIRQHTEYLLGVTRLKIHHAWAVARSQTHRFSFSKSLRECVDLWRNTSFYDGGDGPENPDFSHPEWERLCRDLVAAHVTWGGYADSHALEEACMERLWPMVEPRISTDAQPPRKGPDRPYGAWSATRREENQTSVHLVNTYRPDSPFEHAVEFAGDLLRLLDDTRRKEPEQTVLFCGSWMNSLPVFQAFFPPEWRKSLHRPVWLNGSQGIWGQYIDRCGGFHQVHAQHLRDTGRHAFPLVHACCGMDAAMDHLAAGRWKTTLAELNARSLT